MTLIKFYPMLKVGNNGWEPEVDIFETKDDFVISVELPGIKKDNVSLTLEDQILTLKGEKKRETSDRDENYNLKERRFGNFCRSFVMPDSINSEKIKTNFKDGLLRVSIPKSEVAKEKEIKVEFKSA
ncbi:MAG: Hsp20/alpha crystallin family protein [candidate division Zixibacteria bacterium]|nr:Hsp20/alpha crystallin family protein [candidate division Zixibacteria bacterium]